MTDIIIIAILAAVVALGGWSAVKHFRGEGGCCGGGTYKARKKKLPRVTEKKLFRVEGMHCRNCVNRVMEAVNDIDGASAAVRLKKGEVIVSKAFPIEDSVITAAIEKAGYTVL